MLYKAIVLMSAAILWWIRLLYMLLFFLAVSALFYLLSTHSFSPGSLRVLRVAVPEHTLSTGIVAPFGPGFDEELLQQFCRDAGLVLRRVSVTNRGEGFVLLQKGFVDLLAGFPALEETGKDIVMGPPYFYARKVDMVIPEKQPSPIRAGGSATAEPESAAGQEAGRLMELDNGIDRMVAETEETALAIMELAAGTRDGEKLTPELPDEWRMDTRSWQLWAPFVKKFEKQLKAVERESSTQSYHWFWRAGESTFGRLRLEDFWRRLTRPEDQTLASLEDKYFSYLRKRTSQDVMLLLKVVEKRLPRYGRMLARAAEKAGIDPLIFTAVVIQESRLDENCVSHTGVKGIMQLTLETAGYLKVDRMNPRQALEGGARYLRMLWDGLEDDNLSYWDRWFFVMAAFNQGPTRLKGARKLAVLLGGEGRRWSSLKKVYPLLAHRKYTRMINQGISRGGEAVVYVDRIRWYYHILRGLIALDRPEAQYLAPLL